MPLAVAGLLMASCGPALATNGYFPHGFGTKSKGMAGAGSALALDAMTQATNPAADAFLDTQFDLGAALFFPDRGFNADNNAASPPFASVPPGFYHSDNDIFVLPHFGLNYRLDDRQAVGFALIANGGLNSDYDQPVFRNFGPPPPSPFAARGQTLADLAQMGLQFTYAHKLTPNQALGFSPIFAVQRVRIEGLQPFQALSTSPANVTDKGYDYSFGGGFRIGWQGHFFDDRVHFGTAYQSPLWMTRFDKYKGLFANQGEFDIPANLSLGLAVNPIPKLTLAVDAQRVFFGDVDALGNSNALPAAPGTLGGRNGLGFGWRNIWIGKFGVSYELDDNWTLRAGYSKAEGVIPGTQALFNILAPATVTQHYTMGFTRKISKASALDFSFMWAPNERVHGTNPNTGPQTGYLELEQYEAELNWTYKF